MKKKAKKKKAITKIRKVKKKTGKRKRKRKASKKRTNKNLPTALVTRRLQTEPETLIGEVIDGETKGRIDWEYNHSIIKTAYWNYLNANGDRPTIRKIAKATGFALDTIHKHLKSITMIRLKDYSNPVLLEKVIDAVAINAIRTGKEGPARLYLEFHGWDPAQRVNPDTPDYRDNIKEVEQKQKDIPWQERSQKLFQLLRADN